MGKGSKKSVETNEKAAPKEKIYSVSEITRLIKDTLESEFSSVWLEGESSRVTDHASGHLYMTLKEEKDTIDVTMWRSSRANLKFLPEQGMLLLVKGRLSVYGPYGKYQVIAEKIEPAGLGALQIRFEQLKKKLAAKGYFGEERKRKIPEHPVAIGIVTSESGAAFRDIARIAHRRNPGVKLILAPVLVEGGAAAGQIAQAIEDFNRFGKVDVLIVGRGGGSPESLWAFNEEIVADAIYKSKIPVISAVGHEIDFTISDFSADLRASTPSAAAELAVKNRADLLKDVGSLYERLTGATLGMMRDLRGQLRELARRPIFTDPTRFMEQNRMRIDELFSRMVSGVKRNRLEIDRNVSSIAKHLHALKPSMQIKRKKDQVESLRKNLYQLLAAQLGGKRRRFETAGGKLNALSPMKVLERGYSITRKPDGAVITDQAQTKIGELLEILLHKGRVAARVENKISMDKSGNL
ncbi:MAG: exodeoxyribonuclease VII large subunit [Nitrospinota bacterium]